MTASKVAALLNPRNVVVLGATEKPGNWPQRVWRNLDRYGFAAPVYPMNPGRAEVWGTRCYRTYAELPEPPDHVVMLIPASAVPKALREAAAAGARSVTVMSAGFAEAGVASAALDAELKRAIEETGLGVSGPNCLGNQNAAVRLMTMPDDRAQKVAVGPVAIVGQSGGIAMAIKRTLEERGTDTSIVVTSGNEAGLTTADYISYFAELPEIRVIVSYLESVHGSPDAFLAACRKARAAGKPVIILKLGASDAGRQAAMAHTGALAGSIAAFDAVATAAGAIRMRNTDDVVEAVELLLHTKIPAGPRCGGITLSGGMRGLLMDAASAHGLAFEHLSTATAGRLRQQLAVGAQLANPIDGGFAALTNPNALFECVEAMIADPAIDVVLVQEELPRAPGTERKERNIMRIDELAAQAGKPVAFVSMISHSSNDYTREFRAKVPHVAFLQECDKSLRVLATVIRAGETSARGPVRRRDPDAARRQALELIRARAGQRVLNEVDSKAVLAAYGLPGPRERLVNSRAAAVAAARDLGGPVVAKIVSAGIAHKSEVGGVKVGLAGDDAVAAAYDQLSAIPARVGADFDGVLVAEMVRDGTEVVLGAKWDPEMGPVVLFGSGGIAVELYQDVALAAAPLDEAAAADLIARTRVGRLIDGFRGGAPLDVAGLCRSLMALGDLMRDAEGEIVEIDVNPVLVTPTRSVALDGLIVLRVEP